LAGKVSPFSKLVSLFRASFPVSGTCVIGLQWGDEAKGKLVDLLTEKHDYVVRYQGGANAGHTVVAGDQVYKLSLIPSGILNPRVTSVITGGVVLNPPSILGEIDQLLARNVEVGKNLIISDRAHVIFPWHMAEDRAMDGDVSGGEAIGSTQRGIGPCYRDKVGRAHAIRLGDLYRDDFRDRVQHVVAAKNKLLPVWNPLAELLNADKITDEFLGYAERLKPYVGDTTSLLLDAAEGGKRLLFEGAQGALLDIDHGTFPYVTSSNSSGVGVASGSGVPAKWITRILGVVKAYNTRVGGGPFPTEQNNDIGQHIRDKGNEYGTVTKRPRRCGWFDVVAARYTSRLSGVDGIAVMLLDVLSELPEIKVCVAYEINGQRVTNFPSQLEDLRQAQPVYETLPGWQTEITGVRKISDLPAKAQAYVLRIGELVGQPVDVVSVGPDRAQTMWIRP
jgi:adenylosuccinate synthase